MYNLSDNQFGNSAPDTYQMVWNTHFFFTLKGPNQRLRSFSIKIDGTEIKNGLSGNQLEFQIDPITLTDGNHLVEVDMIVDTGSGSLANLIQAEYYYITKSFIIVVDKVPPQPISSLALAIENGLLKMKWDKLNKTNFTLHVQRAYWIQFNKTSLKFVGHLCNQENWS